VRDEKKNHVPMSIGRRFDSCGSCVLLITHFARGEGKSGKKRCIESATESS